MIIELVVAPPESARKYRKLLVPEPSTTETQVYVGLEAPCSLTPPRTMTERNSGQVAYLFEGDFSSETRFSFHFAPSDYSSDPTDIFVDFNNRFTCLDADLTSFLQFQNNRPSACDIASAVQKRFRYGPHNPAFSTPVAFCGVGTGNCIDINTVLLASLRKAGIEAAYQAGFYFKNNVPGCPANGMHCWVSTRESCVSSDWDIAHCLIAGLSVPIAELNPLGGVRAAFSYGRGLVFADDDLVTPVISHLARPYWIGSDNDAHEANITAELKQPIVAEKVTAAPH